MGWFIKGIGICVWLCAWSLAHAETKVGVVVMHGKWGNPNGPVRAFADALENAGFLVQSPELPWSGKRLYDAGVGGLLSDVDASAQQLRDKGAEKICVAGHSLGASGAIVYAGKRKIDCLIVLAPGHNPEGSFMRGATAADIATARDMVAKGAGDEKASFTDYNSGSRTKQIRMPAKTFIEYFDGDGPFNMANNAAAIMPGTPVLWVVGQEEADGAKRLGGQAYLRVPETAPKRFVEVPGGHLATPEKSTDIAIAWIRETLK